MPTATVPQQSAWNYPATLTQPCYSETTDQFGKTVFASPGQGTAIHFSNVSSAIGSNISIDGAYGQVTLSGNITYRFDLYCDVTAASQNTPVPDGNFSGHALIDITNFPNTSVIYPVFPMGTSGTVYYTPAVDSTILYLAFVPDAEPGSVTGASTWQYPSQLKNASLSVAAVSGYEV
jgi:hypothetical protein